MNSVTVKTRIASAKETERPRSEVQRQRVRQAGAIRRISVAVLVDGISTTTADGEIQWEARPAEELVALRELVVAAIGYDEKRGDIVTIESMRFQPNSMPGSLIETSTWMRLLERNTMTLIQILVLAVVTLILGLAVVRPILTRPIAAPSRPSRAIAAAGGSVGSLPAPGEQGRVAALPGETDSGLSLGQPSDSDASGAGQIPDGEMLRLAVTERPEQAASMLRDWLTPGDEAAA
jgi:flagellar M-ring protein FliF